MSGLGTISFEVCLIITIDIVNKTSSQPGLRMIFRRVYSRQQTKMIAMPVKDQSRAFRVLALLASPPMGGLKGSAIAIRFAKGT